MQRILFDIGVASVVEESPNALVRHNEALKLRFAPAFDAYSFAVLVATIFNGECTVELHT